MAAEYASALSLELLRGPPPESRDFVRLKFKNGTEGGFHTLRMFDHPEDEILVTEFIYRLEVRGNPSQAQVPVMLIAFTVTAPCGYAREVVFDVFNELVPVQHWRRRRTRQQGSRDAHPPWARCIACAWSVCVGRIPQAHTSEARGAAGGDAGGPGTYAINSLYDTLTPSFG